MVLGHVFVDRIRNEAEIAIEQEDDDEGEDGGSAQLADGADLERMGRMSVKVHGGLIDVEEVLTMRRVIMVNQCNSYQTKQVARKLGKKGSKCRGRFPIRRAMWHLCPCINAASLLCRDKC